MAMLGEMVDPSQPSRSRVVRTGTRILFLAFLFAGCDLGKAILFNATDSAVEIEIVTKDHGTIRIPSLAPKQIFVATNTDPDFLSVEIRFPSGRRINYTHAELEDLARNASKVGLVSQWRVTEHGLEVVPSK
jgi:hypothetical protein